MEIDFFRSLKIPDDKKVEAINMRYQELKAEFGNEIAEDVKEARRNGDTEKVKILQRGAMSQALLTTALEFGLIPARPTTLTDYDMDDPRYLDAFDWPEDTNE